MSQRYGWVGCPDPLALCTSVCLGGVRASMKRCNSIKLTQLFKFPDLQTRGVRAGWPGLGARAGQGQVPDGAALESTTVVLEGAEPLRVS